MAVTRPRQAQGLVDLSRSTGRQERSQEVTAAQSLLALELESVRILVAHLLSQQETVLPDQPAISPSMLVTQPELVSPEISPSTPVLPSAAPPAKQPLTASRHLRIEFNMI